MGKKKDHNDTDMMSSASASTASTLHTTESVLARLHLQSLAGHQFSFRSPLGALYEQSKALGPAHSEGAEAFHALERYRASLVGVEGRMDAPAFWRRMGAVIEFAKTTLRNLAAPFPEGAIEGIVIYGSVVRGKAAANDLDVRVATTYSQGEVLDPSYPILSPTENAVHRLALNEQRMPLIVDGLSINTGEPWSNSEFRDSLGQGLWYVTRCPYLAFVRLGEVGPHGILLGTFFNSAGKEYLAERPI